MNRLSERLLHIAAQVQPGETLADIGCDHGYLPIYLVKNGCMRRAIAMDINEGPLLRAKEHIAQEALDGACGQAYIETRLSNGFENLQPGEADAAIIAGMGGNLTIDILTRGKAVVARLSQLILEPQSELAAVRAFLRAQDYCIAQEDFVLEDGKFYPILRVVPTQCSDTAAYAEAHGLALDVLDAYGHRLLDASHPVLAQFLRWEQAHCEQILAGLPDAADGERIAARRGELLERLSRNAAAQAYMQRTGA